MILNRFFACLPRPHAPIAIVILAASFLLAENASAQQSPEMRATYGRGVHALFANRTSEAERMFTQVVSAGSTDPRVYYFRAIALTRLGRKYEAEQDMRIGAAYEARDPGNQHSIGQALQRIQGPARRTLERFRRDGRLNRAQQRRSQSQQRYEHLQQRNPKVLRRENPVQLDQLLNPAPQLIAPTVEPIIENVPQPAVPMESAPVEEATEVTPPADEDLFGDPTPEPPSEAPAEEMPAESNDLFGDPAPAESADDPFGEAPAEEAPAEEIPAESDDLFGEAPAEEAPAEEMPAESDDLFGDPAPTESADLPFGDAAPTDEAPAEEMPAESDGLFDDPAPTESADDPFGEAAPAEAAPAEEMPAESDDLFGEAAPAEEMSAEPDDLFGEPATEEPASESSDAPADDLFGAPVPSESTPAAPPQPATPAETADDPFGIAPPAASEATEEPAMSEEDGEVPAAEEPAVEEDDLFGAAPGQPSDNASSTPDKLTTSDKVESGKLAGILKRVVTNTVPWRGIRFSKLGPQGAVSSADASSPDEFQLGPSSDGSATRASAEEPLAESTDDLFGNSTSESPSDEDPFSDLEETPSNEEAPAEENTTPSSEDDDPFGDF